MGPQIREGYPRRLKSTVHGSDLSCSVVDKKKSTPYGGGSHEPIKQKENLCGLLLSQ